jgi:SAM-dependent methyltransferase
MKEKLHYHSDCDFFAGCENMLVNFFSDTNFNDFAENNFVIEKAVSMAPSLVIDAGCGTNLYKNKIPNLIGFDPGDYETADFKSTILEAEFKNKVADVILVQGSIQFISKPYIRKNIKKILSWLRPGGIVIGKANFETTFLKEVYTFNNFIKNIPWSLDFLYQVTNENNLEFETEPFIEPWTNLEAINRLRSFYPSERFRPDELTKLNWVWKKPHV